MIRPAKALLLTILVLITCASCNKTPTAPTPPVVTPPPVVADPPEITCPNSISASAIKSTGVVITYPAPEIRKGQGSGSVACTPTSGSTFPVGVTQTECVATDSLNRTASCTFSITVAAPPRLSRTRILAWGDSLTAGATVLGTDPYVVPTVPEISYPTVLAQLLSARYTDQTINVFNSGLPGEQAGRALPRFIGTFPGLSPDVVVLQEGYNDYNQAVGSSGDAIEGAARGITELAGEARRRGARVFICTLAPSRPGRVSIPMSAIQAMNDRFRQIARSEGAVLVDVFSALLPDVNGNVSIDGLHLTALGYRRVAETVFASIRAELEVK